MQGKKEPLRGDGGVQTDAAHTLTACINSTPSGEKSQIPDISERENGKNGNCEGDAPTLFLKKVAEVLSPLSRPEFMLRRAEIAENLGASIPVLNAVYREIEQARRAASREEIPSDARQGADLTFPEAKPWLGAVDGEGLFNEIEQTLRRYVVLPEPGYVVAALYTVFTYIYEKSNICPMLVFRSAVKGSGKTRALTIISRLVHRCVSASNVSPAAIYRCIQFYRPVTLTLDELDRVFGSVKKTEVGEELRNILNSGHTTSAAYTLRCVGDSNEVKQFSTFCPKICACIGALPETIEDRSFVILMQRRSADEPISRFSEIDSHPEIDAIRSKITRWVTDTLDEIVNAEVPPIDELRDRQNDNARPLLQIARAMSSQTFSRSAEALKSLCLNNDEAEEYRLVLLQDTIDIIKMAGRDLFTSEILERLQKIEMRSYSKLTPKGLAKVLREFGVSPTTIHRKDGESRKGYRTENFDTLTLRYKRSCRSPVPDDEPVLDFEGEGGIAI